MIRTSNLVHFLAGTAMTSFVASAYANRIVELDCTIDSHMVIDFSGHTDGIFDAIEFARARTEPEFAHALAYESPPPPCAQRAGVVAASQPMEAMYRNRRQALQKQPVQVAGSSAATRLTASASPPQRLSACQTIGPIETLERAGELQKALRGVASSIRLREETTPTSGGFIVASAYQGSVNEAKALAEHMRDAGLGDMFVFGRGPHKSRISFGLYRNEKWAAERVKEVNAAGFFAEVLARGGEVTRYWVDFVSRSQLPPEARALLIDLQAQPADCETTRASRG
jgi:hypothetical protein